jgi:hypothetical protein
MDTSRPDIIQLLEQEKKYYLEQIKRVNIAISALRGDVTTPSAKDDIIKKDSIPWTKEILRVFDYYNNLTMDDICNKIAENGIPEALDKSNRNTIQALVHRQVAKHNLIKDDKGIFVKLKKIENDDLKLERESE